MPPYLFAVVYRRFPAVHGSHRERLLCGKQALGVRNELHAHFGLDENHMVYAGIALGWSDPEEPANRLYAERAPLGEAVEFRGF